MGTSLSLVVITAVACASSMASAQSLFGPEWIEQGDAGRDSETAQPVTTTGPVTKISGQLQGPTSTLNTGFADFEDVYRVVISVPTAFYLRTDPSSGGGADFNTQLFVFSADGHGILGNDDASNPGVGSAVFQFATDSTEAGIYEPGVYLIAISGLLNRPTSGGNHIFFFASPTEISGPDGEGGDGILDGWDTDPNCHFGDYILSLQGITGVPGPGALAVVAGGLLLGRSRRRGA